MLAESRGVPIRGRHALELGSARIYHDSDEFALVGTADYVGIGGAHRPHHR